ncbi:hypothetical protein H4R34_005576 [Dimargaris verticillata]|uniref:Uncharacterized protein n=1 Tax=Dimargaris verticillata TaxID=2761393 RepID=A0A9W8AYN8_9FUNG|nr:hypothetical protein H4R34_005576 [Dimargaris verticillata]
MARIYLLALLVTAQLSLYAAKAKPIYGQGDGAASYRVKAYFDSLFPAYAIGQGDDAADNERDMDFDSIFPDYATGQGYDKADVQDYLSHKFPIPSDQQNSDAGESQYSSSPYPMIQDYPLTGEAQYTSNANLFAHGGQPTEATGQLSQSQGQSNYYFGLAKSHFDRTNDPEIRAELQGVHPYKNEIWESALSFVRDLQFQIHNYYSQPQVAALGLVGEYEMPLYNPVIPDIVGAIDQKHFIAFLYIDTESKQLMFRHPYSDKMFREVDYGKLQTFLTMSEYFSSVYIIPTNIHHFVIHMALMEQVDTVNFSNDPVRHMFDGKQMPPKNSIFQITQ